MYTDNSSAVTRYPVSEEVRSNWHPKPAPGIPSVDGSDSDADSQANSCSSPGNNSESDANSLNIPEPSSLQANRYPLRSQAVSTLVAEAEGSEGSDDVEAVRGLGKGAEVITVSSGMLSCSIALLHY